MVAKPTPTAEPPAEPRTRPQQIPARSLRHPVEYGRPLRARWVNRLIREWDDDKVGDLLVSQRADGRFYTIAGNHRVKAKIEAGEPLYLFDCKVYVGLTLAEEADIYLAQDSERLRHSVADDFPAMLARADPSAVGVQAVLDEVGLEIAPYGLAGYSPYRVRCVSSLLSSYEVNGPENLRFALQLLKEEWGAEAASLSNSKKSIYSEATVNSLPAFLRLYGTEGSPLEVAWLRKAMARERLTGWEDAWVAHRSASRTKPYGGIAIVYGVLAWVDLYNYSRREANRLDDMVARRASKMLGKKRRGGGA